MEQNPQLLKAFIIALRQYKPWHTPQWKSTGNDAFPQIVDGAIKLGFLDPGQATRQFDVSEQALANWQSGVDIPERKTRIKVWKALKRDAGISP